MSIYAVDYTNQASGLYDIFGVNGVSGVDAVSGYGSGGSAQKTSTSSGDTVSISDAARELFARKTQMLQMQNDQTEQASNLGAGNTSSPATSEKRATVDNGLTHEDGEAAGAATGSAEGGEGSGSSSGRVAASGGSEGGGGGGGADSGSGEDDDRQQELESQLQSLQSQLLGILSGGGSMDVNEVKAGPIQSQIRAVEAELNALKSQKAKG